MTLRQFRALQRRAQRHPDDRLILAIWCLVALLWGGILATVAWMALS